MHDFETAAFSGPPHDMFSRRALLSHASLILAASVLPAEAAKPRKPKLATGQVYLFRGFANIFSTGLDTLGKRLAEDGIGHFNIDKNPELHHRAIKEITHALRRR
jgi:hypothetical protein